MKFLANENFPLSSIRILKEAGNEIIVVGIEFQGVSDEEVISLAKSENRTILTITSYLLFHLPLFG